MDVERFDNLTRAHAAGVVSRRTTLKALAIGSVAPLFGGLSQTAEAKPRKQVCERKNWCERRTDLCARGEGKCFVRRFGGNVCGQLLFQATSCEDCKPSNCTDCICILAAGGGDKCNNGTGGADYVCIRKL